jgi:hypothetical protein
MTVYDVSTSKQHTSGRSYAKTAGIRLHIIYPAIDLLVVVFEKGHTSRGFHIAAPISTSEHTNRITELADRTAELISPTGMTGRITSFGSDGSGNLYRVSRRGQRSV